MRRLLIYTTVIAGFSLPAAVSVAQSQQQSGAVGRSMTENVIAENATGGTVVALSGLETSGAGRDAGSPGNLARANAHDCTSPCQAIAAAFQIVLVPSGITIQAPQNVALATNVNCDHCGAFAYAYQYVVHVAGDASLSGRARHQITRLRHEAARDVRAGLAYPALDARLHDVATRLRAVIDGDLTQQHVGEQGKQSSQTVKQHPAA